MSNKYELTEHGVLDLETGASIPNAEGNRHWQEFLTWELETGKAPRPIKPNQYCTWDEQVGGWVEDTVTKQKDIDNERIKQLDQEMIASADTLLECLINKGILTGTEPEIAVLVAKKAEKASLKVKYAAP